MDYIKVKVLRDFYWLGKHHNLQGVLFAPNFFVNFGVEERPTAKLKCCECVMVLFKVCNTLRELAGSKRDV